MEEGKEAIKGDNGFKREVEFRKEEGEKYENKGINDIKCGSSNTPDTLLKNRSHPFSTTSPTTSRDQTEDTTGYLRLKLCKRGHREQATALVCGVCFEGLPIWLWDIRLVDWSKIYLSEGDEVRLRTQHHLTWTFVEKRLAIVSNEDMAGLVDVDLWL
jgi:hypothetical protein